MKTTTGPEFSLNLIGQTIVIIWALYGLKYSTLKHGARQSFNKLIGMTFITMLKKQSGNYVTRHLYMGVLAYVNSAPITWYSKTQARAESLTFGAEFIVLWIAVEMLKALLYKLCMFGMPIPDLTLKKNHTI
jgi:hypothetical protein